jgi:leucyl/phenylalanyl-tRNA---protein transferase
MIDCQQRTGHLASLGGREVPRSEFERRLSLALGAPAIGDWTYDVSMWRHLLKSDAGGTAEKDGPE